MQSINSTAAIAAHRGWHMDGAASNGIAALDQAAANGADFVELDIRRLGDGTMVVNHDPAISGIPLEHLNRKDLQRFPHVSTLEHWSRRAGQLDIGILAELKESGYEADVLDVFRRNLNGNRLDLMSFDANAVQSLARLAPDHAVGKLSDVVELTSGGHVPIDGAALIRDARATGASFLGLHVRQSTEGVLELAHRSGFDVAVWTVDEVPDLARLLADDRVATVISDVPNVAQRIRAGLGAVAGGTAGIRLLRAAATMR